MDCWDEQKLPQLTYKFCYKIWIEMKRYVRCERNGGVAEGTYFQVRNISFSPEDAFSSDLILFHLFILSATAKIRSKVKKYLWCGRSEDASSGEKHQFLWLCKWNLELRQIWGIGKTYFGPKEIQCHQSNHFIMKPRAPVEALFYIVVLWEKVSMVE